MSEELHSHFLKISGRIYEHKKNEFENTVRFACKLEPMECLEKSLSVERGYGDKYYFFASWNNEWSLRTYLQSEEYQLVRSAFDALGMLQKIEIAYNCIVTTISIRPL